jgi:hypothetical protein
MSIRIASLTKCPAGDSTKLPDNEKIGKRQYNRIDKIEEEKYHGRSKRR